MANLLSGRDIVLHLEKRAICSKNKLLEVFNKAVEDKMKFYGIYCIYNEIEYIICCSFDDEGFHCGYSEANEDAKMCEFNSIDELINNLPIEHEVTIIYENIYFPAYDSIMLFDVDTNYLLKDCIVDKENPKYSFNMNTELEDKLAKMKEEAKKEGKKITIFLVGIVICIILFFLLMYIFVWSKQ